MQLPLQKVFKNASKEFKILFRSAYDKYKHIFDAQIALPRITKINTKRENEEEYFRRTVFIPSVISKADLKIIMTF